MPKVTKDTEKDELINKKTVAKRNSKSTTKKPTKTINKKSDTKTRKKNTNTKSENTIKKEKSLKITSNKKKLSTSTNKRSKNSTTKKATTKVKKLEDTIVAEYYDLPYRYNETIVRILYQTPSILFVYWDISDTDRENLIKQYGKNFFYNTKPILKIFNLTKNYSFEIEINDFANSWYINVEDANCDYKVELARRTVHYEENLNTDYIYLSSSNSIEFPNDHILIEELPDFIRFKNVKTNKIDIKNIKTLHFIGIQKIYNVNDFYKKFYKNEILEEINHKKLCNPSSSSWS